MGGRRGLVGRSATGRSRHASATIPTAGRNGSWGGHRITDDVARLVTDQREVGHQPDRASAGVDRLDERVAWRTNVVEGTDVDVIEQQTVVSGHSDVTEESVGGSASTRIEELRASPRTR